jgi:hypothetical protein
VFVEHLKKAPAYWDGWMIVASPTGFFVKGKKSTKRGELERAAKWAKEIVKSKESTRSKYG